MRGQLGHIYRRAMRRISRRFVNGLLVLVPVVITAFVIEWTLRFTEGVLGQYLPFYFPGMGIITLMAVIYLVGWGSTNWALAKLISLVNKVEVPNVIGKRLSEAVLDSSSNFTHVVHVPYMGGRALGFVMADLPPRFQEAMGGGYLCVFIPWSLNMTSGTTLLVREEDAVTINISKEEALQYMLTAGAVMPMAERKKDIAQKNVRKTPAAADDGSERRA